MSEFHVLDHVVLDPENPWPGLHEFDENGKDFFNGRDQEIADLLRLVNDAPLTVLFGASGLGKTSLLLAGLMPSLRQQNKLPVYVRFDPRDQRAPLMEQAAAAFRAELRAHGVDHRDFPDGESLWEYVHGPDFELWSKSNQLLTPVFIFDQFEEVFTLGSENTEAVRRLREDLADLVENRVPVLLARRLEHAAAEAPRHDLQSRRLKVVLSFREDFLPEVEDWRGALPSLARNRLRLLPMNGQQALTAVTKTGGRLVDRDAGRAIVSFVAAARAGLHVAASPAAAPTAAAPMPESDELAQATIEPALLSLVCTGLNERRKAAHKAAIDQALLSGTGLAIITEFYEGCVRDLPEPTRRFIEDQLITESGFRNPYSREDAVARGYLSDAQLVTLVKRRLLRVERHLGTDRIELVHDLLTGVVRTFRDEERIRTRRELDARQNRRFRRRTLVVAIGGASALIVSLVFFRLWTENERIRVLDEADKKRAEALTVASQEQYDRAITLLSDPLSVYEKAEDSRRTVRALVDRGRIYLLAGKLDLAEQDFQQALGTAGRKQNAGDEALALESLAALREQSGNKDAAAPLYEQALEKYRTAGDSLSIARVLEWMATREEMLRHFVRAASIYESALESYLIAGEPTAVTRVKAAISRTVPWGFLLDLKRGQVFPMRGDRITIGRDVPEADIRNDLSFASDAVSRRHLVISHERFQTDDLRSANGTTVNAAPLRYGIGAKLSDGDVVVLANKEVLLLTAQQPTVSSMPLSTWAIFIDGSTRNYVYLTEPMYSVELTSTGLRIERGDIKAALLKIRRGQQRPELFNAVAEWSVVLVRKKDDYTYEELWLPSRQWTASYDLPAQLLQRSPNTNRRERRPAFQIVTVTND